MGETVVESPKTSTGETFTTSGPIEDNTMYKMGRKAGIREFWQWLEYEANPDEWSHDRYGDYCLFRKLTIQRKIQEMLGKKLGEGM